MNRARRRMSENIEELIAKKMVNSLFPREFNIFQLERGISVPVKTFYSLILARMKGKL
jgi:hypothetical protein